jgi:hypothetical protein
VCPCRRIRLLVRAAEAEFEVGGRRYAVYAHDWRAEPALAWLDRMAERELATDQRVDLLEAELSTPLLVLSEPEFQAAVRQALRDYTRPAAPADNPLLRSRLASQAAAGAPTAATLQTLLREAAEALAANPRTSVCTGRWPVPSSSRRPPRSWPPNASACRSAPTATTWPAGSGGSPSGCGGASSTGTRASRFRREFGSDASGGLAAPRRLLRASVPEP